jgi:hypothetical protein
MDGMSVLVRDTTRNIYKNIPTPNFKDVELVHNYPVEDAIQKHPVGDYRDSSDFASLVN